MTRVACAKQGNLAGCGGARPGPGNVQIEPFRMLVFTGTAGFRHLLIPAGRAAVRQLADAGGFEVTVTEDPTRFSDENLAHDEVVLTTADVLDTNQEAAFERFIRGGELEVNTYGAEFAARMGPIGRSASICSRASSPSRGRLQRQRRRQPARRDRRPGQEPVHPELDRELR